MIDYLNLKQCPPLTKKVYLKSLGFPVFKKTPIARAVQLYIRVYK